MKVLVAGATSVLGSPVMEELVVRGHQAVGITRSPKAREAIERRGHRAAIADVFNPASLKGVMADERPEAVVSLLIALPKRGPTRVRDFQKTIRLWREGVPNLLVAASAAGVRRVVAESVIFAHGYQPLDPDVTDEHRPVTGGAVLEGHEEILDALRSMEQRVLSDEHALEAVVLRYGIIHGAGVPSTRFLLRALRWRLPVVPGGGGGILSWIELGDAARATVYALERARAGEIYNVVDDEPVAFRDYVEELARSAGVAPPRSAPAWLARRLLPHAQVMLDYTQLPMSNAKARDELGWRPQFPTYREAVAQIAGQLPPR